MDIEEMCGVYLERVFRMPYHDESEWDSWKKAHLVEVGNPIILFSEYIEKSLAMFEDLDTLCRNDRVAYLNALPADVLNPPPVYF